MLPMGENTTTMAYSCRCKKEPVCSPWSLRGSYYNHALLGTITEQHTQTIKNLTIITLFIPMLVWYLPTREPPYLYNALLSPEPKQLVLDE